MDDIENLLNESFSHAGQSNVPTFEAEVVASLMIQSNAFISIKTAAKLCSLSRQSIDRRIQQGTFPPCQRLSSDDKAIRKAFRIRDIQQWMDSPITYRAPR